jgi:hypothetical protein
MPNSIETFAQYCAPSALAAIVGCPRIEAAELLDSIPGMRMGKGAVCGSRWYRFLRDHGFEETNPTGMECGRAAAQRVADRRNAHPARWGGGWTADHCFEHPQAQPTVAAVLRELPANWTGILTTGRHTLAIVNGESRDNLHTNSRRSRVERIHTLPA